jgi:hypothetical protein
LALHHVGQQVAFFDKEDLYSIYTESKAEAYEWRRDYKEYERLADNDLLADLDESLPEVNDGTLSAALFKLPKRIVSSNLQGRAKALDADDAWITELANMQWEKEIVPMQTHRLLFTVSGKTQYVRPRSMVANLLLTLFVKRGEYTGADFIVPQAQDVYLEAGKVSDYDSDVIYWDVYYSKLQVKNMIEQAEEENKEKDGYNKWDVEVLKEILAKKEETERDQNEEHNQKDGKAVKKGGIKFCITFQRGVKAPFYMYHSSYKERPVREWENPDPTGDIPVHYLFCYQDFINPYGTGIVKLAGGTQNVLDYFRQADILATQLGLKRPKMIKGDDSQVDYDSLVYAEDADWIVGNAEVELVELSSGIYQSLPERIQMYKSSLNNLIPMGDTTISATAGDPLQSKTPAGVKQAQASLSIDDEDFKDNLYMTFEAKAKSMINTHFANMQGTDLMKLSDEERDILAKAGLKFPIDEEGNPTNELEVVWEEARATFDFEVEAENDKTKDEEKRLEGLLKVAELKSADPLFDQEMLMSGKKLNMGELYTEVIGLTTDNKKIIEDVSPEDQAMQEQANAAGAVDPNTGQPIAQPAQQPQPTDQPTQGEAMPPDQPPANPETAHLMDQYGVDQPDAEAMLAALEQGFTADEVLQYLSTREQEQPNVQG